MKRAIVTGANGFVGSALLHTLEANGIAVTAVIRNRQSDLSRIADVHGLNIVYCGMDELERLPDLVEKNADIFYHLAWEGSSGPERANYRTQLKNIQWSLNAVGAAAEIGCSRFVGAGSLAELDVGNYSFQNGATPNAVSCYGAAKIAAHLMTKIECNKLGIAPLWARLSNTYGIGDYTSNFINFAAKLMITGQPANFTTAEQMYDFVHVSDVAMGLYKIGQFGKPYYSYYIGSAKPRKLKEYITALRDTIAPNIPLNLGAVPFNGVLHAENIFDCSQLVQDTGYQPEIEFETGIIDTVAWLRNQIAEGNL